MNKRMSACGEPLADDAGFDAVMDAIVSNGQPVDGEEAAAVSLLLERRAT